MIKDFKHLLEEAQKNEPVIMSVAVAQDDHVLDAVKEAMALKLITPILVGDEAKIREIAKEVGLNLDGIRIIHEEDITEAAKIATKLVHDKEADLLMKGIVDTSIIMKQVLNKEYGLRSGNVISHIAVLSVPTYHKLFVLTDAAMNIAPDLETKAKILRNAVDFTHSLGIENPKVGILAAKEKVSDSMPATLDAQALVEMNKNGEIDGCIVDGPFALDNAMSAESAKIKGMVSDVAGDCDILLAPAIEAGNVGYKAITVLGGGKVGGLILGASAPIVLTSRADSAESKLYSIALGAMKASHKA
ncbi:MAG: bifunctional enoyl-CoA hydratase/phosphate acetyltransferase [Tissierellia bacterium]|nr:bifunctional enoyl-CoA hydratase/phosphate acetyltransferase [Tissierellia bacterium]